mgnify:CR=1 FL=1
MIKYPIQNGEINPGIWHTKSFPSDPKWRYESVVNSMPKSLFLFVLISILLSGTLAGCSASGESTNSSEMASMDGMPAEVKSAPVTVQQAYQFAVANPEIVKEFPCYCGCGKMGHTSNYSCYVQDEDSTGKITFDTHALGCSICVDITQDVMRLRKEKKSISDIQTYIDNTYSKYGPSNISE